MTNPSTQLRHDVIATARAMGERGINSGSAGNVSVRTGDGMLITPSSVPYADMTAADVVAMAANGDWVADNDRRPSSEWQFHLEVYAARPDAGAIVHTHSTNATALSCHRRGIDSFHYMVGVAGGSDIRCADYATFGTPQLSANVVDALRDRKACLLANHGQVTLGPSLAQALDLAVEVEALASQYIAALAIGEPLRLTSAEMEAVLDKMSAGAGYGSM